MKRKITFQRAFSATWRRWVKNREPRALSAITNSCRYRTENGHTCAVGQFFTAAEYDAYVRKLEESKATIMFGSLPAEFKVEERFERPYLAGFWNRLQEAHDAPKLSVRKARLLKLAERFNLKVPGGI